MRKIFFILFISTIFPQYFGGNISIGGAFPQREFKAQEVPASFAIDLNALYYINDYAAVGLNLGGAQYGYAEREGAMMSWSSVTVTEETRNNVGYGNLLLKIIPFQGPVKIYGEGLIGLKNLNTIVKIMSNSSNCDDEGTDDINECEIAAETKASDTAFGYGIGGGLEVVLWNMKDVEDNPTGILSLIVSAKHLWGGDVEYLKEGGITVDSYDPVTGQQNIIYDWNQSRTDVMHYNIGVHFTSK